MKNTVKIAAFTLAVAALGNAHASIIEFQTGFSSAGPQTSANDYLSVVDAAIATHGSGYGDAIIASYDNISNQALFGSGTNIAFKSTIKFGVTPGETGNWAFRAGVDFGHGGAVFLDGHAIDFRSNDMWWNSSYSDPTQYFQFNSSIGAGNHTLSIYGLEGCCDGGQQVQFNSGSGFQSFDNKTLTPVPEPETYVMLLTGLGVIGAVVRRRKTA